MGEFSGVMETDCIFNCTLEMMMHVTLYKLDLN